MGRGGFTRSLALHTLELGAVYREESDLPAEPAPLGPRDLLPDQDVWELEIGCGKGMFLLDESGRRPEVGFLGIEWSHPFSRFGASGLLEAGRTNALIVRADARRLLPRFPDQSFQAIHAYFPDPWWKRRHRKRRLVSPEFCATAVRLLAESGHLYLATDVEEYFQVMRRAAASSVALVPLSDAECADSPARTHFERKYRKEGRPIYRITYQRSAVP